MRIFAAVTAFLFSFALHAYAQGDSLSPGRYLQVGLGLTGIGYIGDFSNDMADLYRIHPGANFSIQTTGPALIQLQANAGFGKFAEQIDRGAPLFPSDADAAPNRFVETSFYYADLRLKYRFLRQKRIQPYLALGAGVLVFTPRNESGKLLREMPETRDTGETYNTAIPQLPGVVGLQARISPFVSASIDYTYRITPTDYLDNVGKWGSRQGNDALHGLQVSLYFTFRPQSERKPAPLAHVRISRKNANS